MNEVAIVLAFLGIFYSIVTYVVASVVIHMTFNDGGYVRGECSLAYDVFVFVLAPVMVPFEIFIFWCYESGRD